MELVYDILGLTPGDAKLTLRNASDRLYVLLVFGVEGARKHVILAPLEEKEVTLAPGKHLLGMTKYPEEPTAVVQAIEESPSCLAVAGEYVPFYLFVK